MKVLRHWQDHDIMRDVAACYPHLNFVTLADPSDLAAILPEAEIAVCGPGVYTQPVADLYRRLGSRLRWMQFRPTGMETILPLGFPDNVVVTNAPGMSSDTIAEHCFAMLLSLIRQLGPWLRLQDAGTWARDDAVMDRMDRLSGRTMVIVGYGAIAREIASRAKAFGMNVGIVSRSVERDVHIDMLYPRSRLAEALGQADVLVVATSLTPETQGMIGAAEIARLKRSAIIVNIARGALIDEDALTRAVQEGALAGACLDVLAVEPPPADHPLLSLANVIVTPHVASRGSDGRAAFVKLMCRQLDRYLAGEPLLNRVFPRQA